MVDNGANDYTICYEDREGFLYAHVSGQEDSFDTAAAYWQEIFDECKSRGYSRLLILKDFPNQLNTTEIYALVSSIPEMGSTGLKIAFVDREAEHGDLNLFGETVAVNRGVHGRVFSNVDDAEVWLMG